MNKTKILSAVISSTAAMTCVCTEISRNVIQTSRPESSGHSISASSTVRNNTPVREKGENE